jgi:tRNA(Ile)-lysidine synthase
VPPRKRLSVAQGTVRHELRQLLTEHTKPGQKLLVAVSGGADSMALAAALEFEAKKLKLQISAAVIDHSLQKNSSKIAKQTADALVNLGYQQVVIESVQVAKVGGPEAAAREARYSALEKIRKQTKSDFVLLGHTQSDQAETVLLGLVRGSGAKSLSGMSPRTGTLLRPLLGIERSTTEQFCKDSGIRFWIDPQNSDTRFVRVMIRKKVLPFLEKHLGVGISKNLVKTGDQLREDEIYLSQVSNKAFRKISKSSGSTLSFAAGDLAKLSPAILNRVIKIALDSFEKESSRVHVLAVADLVLSWHGQKPLSLPGVRVERKGNTITIKANPGDTSGSRDDNR